MNLITDNLGRLEAICKSIDYNSWEDLRQELVIKIMENIDNPKIQDSFFSWCYRVALNIHLQSLRKSNNVVLAEVIKEPADLAKNHFEIIDEIRQELTGIEKMWINFYMDCNCKYVEIEEKTQTISRQLASERIREIIEKCKKLM